MAIQTRREGNSAVVTVTGRLDSVTGPEYRRTMQEVIAGDAARVVVDLHGLTYISSAGVGEMLLGANQLTTKGSQLCLAGVPANILSVLKMCGIDGLLPRHDSVEEALSAGV
jgi:anti-anti-sigma factor